MKWSKEEDELLIELREAGVPYKSKVEIWNKRVEKGVSGFSPRSQDALRNHMNLLRNQDRAEGEKDIVVGVFDIEASNLKANFGYMLSWAIYYPHEDEVVYDVVKRTHILKYKEDYYLCKSLLKELDKIDMLITYNGTRYDNDFARTRCLMHGLPFPHYGGNMHRDVYYMAKSKLCLHRKSQDNVMRALGTVTEKNHVDWDIWNKAKLGHKESLEYVIDHNVKDVRGLWEVYQILKPFSKYRANSI